MSFIIMDWQLLRFIFSIIPAKRIYDFYELRQTTFKKIIFYENLSDNDDRITQANNDFRTLASEYGALKESANLIENFFFNYLAEYNLEEIKKSLIGFSNSLTNRDGSKAIFRYQIYEYLKHADRNLDVLRKIDAEYLRRMNIST